MDEYNIPIGLDLTKFNNDANTVKANLNEINKAAVQVGRNTASAFKQASVSSTEFGKNIIANTNALTAAINSSNDLSKSISEVDKNVQSLGRSGSNLNLNERLNRANLSATGFLGTLRKVGVVMASVFTVEKISQLAQEFFRVAKEGEGVARAFQNLEGSASKNIETLRRSVKGTVSDLELMKVAVRADNFNVPLASLAKGLAFAQQRAVDTGQSVDYLVNSFVDGIGRKSTLVLDNLGISAAELQAEVARVGDFALAAGNIIERSMTQAEDSVDTLGERVSRLEVFFDNAKLSAGLFLADLATEIYDLVTSDSWDEFWSRFANWGNGAVVTQGKNLAKTLTEVRSVMDGFGQYGYTGDPDAIYKAVKAGADYNAMLADAENQFTRINKARREYETGIKSGNLEKEFYLGTTLINPKQFEEVEKDAIKRLENIMRVGARFGLGDKPVVMKVDTKALEVLKKELEDLNRRREVSTNLNEISGLNKEIEAVEKNIARLTGKRDTEAEKAARKAEQLRKQELQREKQVANEKLRIEGEYLSQQVDLIDDEVTKAVAKETTGSQQRIAVLNQRKKEFPELVKEINSLIEQEEESSVFRVAMIIKKGEEERVKQVRASEREIRKVLRSESEFQIDEINAQYEVIRENAKKAGTLTADIEKSLAQQQAKDVAKVTLDSKLKALESEEGAILSEIHKRQRKQGESEITFERNKQLEILAIAIEYSQKRLELIQNDPAKTQEASQLAEAIAAARKEINELKKEQKGDLFELLGLDGEKVMKYADAVSAGFTQISGLFDGLAQIADMRVQKINKEIDAIDRLIDKQEDAVKKEKDLLDKGYANNYENERKTLESQKKNREELLKQQEEAQKKAQALQQAQIIADGISQGSNLITASTEIFKVFSKIPFVGIPLAIGTIGLMLASFATSKAAALKAVKMSRGGEIGGDSHAMGGNKYISLDGKSTMEHEKGEFVIRKTSFNKHPELTRALNEDNFGTLSNAALRKMLDGTGVSLQSDVAKKVGEKNVVLMNNFNTNQSASDTELREMKNMLKKILEIQQNKPDAILDLDDRIIIEKNNNKTVIWKKNISL